MIMNRKIAVSELLGRDHVGEKQSLILILISRIFRQKISNCNLSYLSS